MCQFSGTDLQARQEGIKKQAEIILSGHFLYSCFNWRELKSDRAVSKFTWHLLHEYSLSLHLGDLVSPVKSLKDDQSAFYAGAQNVHVDVNILTHPIQ